MRAEHWLGMILTPCVQALLLLPAALDPPGMVTTRPLALLALVVPFACYVWTLHDAPLTSGRRHAIVRLAVLALVSLALTLGGFIYGLAIVTARLNAL